MSTVVNILFGEAWYIIEFGAANCQLGFESPSKFESLYSLVSGVIVTPPPASVVLYNNPKNLENRSTR
jgi:hypothetical protein